ncbi:MAG: hypothetical protein KGD63_13990 [Candidatus Lokiarchaeota archaeon]|nr:hypothetical protein [Candidatus Lokiarchaeota archaeon]
MNFDLNFHKIKDTARFLDIFIDKYVDKSLIKDRILLWNSLKVKVNLADLKEIYNLNIDHNEIIMLYDERERNLYRVRYMFFLDQYKQLEYWEDPDYLIINEKMEWFIAITHEEFMLIYDKSNIIRNR